MSITTPVDPAHADSSQTRFVEPLVERTIPRPSANEGRWTPRPDLVILIPVLTTLGIGAWSLSGASYWRDEAATLDADSRSLPALLRMLTNVDAVHGAYYLLMWPVVHTIGTAEVVLRMPSLLAMTAAAAGVAALGRRLRSPRAGLLAGLAFAVLPQVSLYAQTARSYALVLGCAVLATHLLVRAVSGPGRRWLVGYGCVIAVLGLLNLFGLLLLAGHAVFVLACHRPVLRRWLLSAVPACLPALPIVALAWHERGQLGWLIPAGITAPGDLAAWLAGSVGAIVPVVAVIVIALRSRTRSAVAWLALPWLILPPALLMIASDVAMPVYTQRYVVFCLPALALLIGVGLDRLNLAPRVIALLLIVGLGLPTQFAARQPGGHTDDARGAATVLSQHERPGDGILYDCPTCQIPDVPRELSFAYPAAFKPLDDLALAASPAKSGTLVGTNTDQATLTRRLDGANRVWLFQMRGTGVPAPLAHSGLHLAAVYTAGDIRVSLYDR